MSLMVNPVSSVCFCANEQNIQDILSRPGAFAKPEQPVMPQNQKSKHTFLKYLAGTLITVGILAGGACLLKNHFPKIFDPNATLDGLKGMEKFKVMTGKYIGKAAEYVEKYADKAVEYAKSGWEKFTNLFKSSKPDA